MKKRISKSLVVLLVVTIFSLLTACVVAPAPAPSVSNVQEGTTTVEPKSDKPEKITAMLQVIVTQEDGRQQLINKYKELTGINLEIINPPSQQYNEKVNLAFASRQIPDIIETSGTDYANFASVGAFVQIDSMIAKSEPLTKINPALLNGQRVGGNLYGLPTAIGGGTVTYIRRDWLNNLGLEKPKTFDELYEVMYQFTYGDPDKNGKDDTFGYIAAGVMDDMYLRDFYQTAKPTYQYKDGKWVDGMVQPEMKLALERMQKAYANKVIDPEIFTNTTSTAREKFYSGKAGIWSYWAGAWGNLIDQTLKTSFGEDSGIVAIPPIEGSYYYNRLSPVHCITSASKIPEGAFKWFLEYIHDGGEGQMLFSHGVENLHWKVEDGKYVKLPTLADPKINFRYTMINPSMQLTPWEDPFLPPAMETETLKIWETKLEQVILMPATETYKKNGSDINTLKEQIISKIVVGELTVDAGLEEYAEKVKELNIEKILTELNAK